MNPNFPLASLQSIKEKEASDIAYTKQWERANNQASLNRNLRQQRYGGSSSSSHPQQQLHQHYPLQKQPSDLSYSLSQQQISKYII